jgi:serine/threonine-protein kinase
VGELTSRIRSSLADRYEVEREIGRGGMSMVYLAHDLKHHRKVAIKVLRPELSASLFAERFLREIEIIANLNHPHVLPMHDSGEADGLLYYVMPFMEGESLRDRLNRESRLAIDEAVTLTGEVADALGFAHGREVIHRDIKPENILLEAGHAVVADFGIAKAVSAAGGERLTDSGIAVGTPAYMSPEQAMGEQDLDARSDQYSLACVLYEMLGGETPYIASSKQALIAKKLSEPTPRITTVRDTVPSGVETALKKALAKTPADRYNSVAEFATALENAAAAAPQAESKPLLHHVATAFRRHRIAATVALVFVVAAAVTTFAVWRQLAGSQPTLDDRRIVVFPLSTTVPGVEGAERGWEAALAIEEALERTEPLKWLDGWGFLPESTRADPRLLTREEAVRITRSAGARYYITGAIRGDSAPSVTLWLEDASADTLVAPSTHTGEAGVGLAALGAIEPLLGRLVEPGRSVDLTPLTDRTNAAIALTLQGDRAYRQAQFLDALDFYQRAVAEDSLSALSAVKGAQAASWAALTEQVGGPLIEVALQADSLLPPKYRSFVLGLHAYYLGEADPAIAYFEAALRSDPEWSEAWMALGEVYNNLLPSATNQDSLAEFAYLRSVITDSLFAPPLVPLAEINARKGDLDSTRAFVERFERIGTDSTYARELRFLVGCLERGPAAMEEAELGDSVGVTLAAMHLATGGSRLDCAEAGYRRMLQVEDLPAAHRNGLVLALSGLLMARGRYDEVETFLDSVVGTGYRGALSLYLVFEALGAPAMRGATYAENLARDLTGDLYETARPTNRWLLGLWQLRNGGVDRAAAIAAGVNQVADSTGVRSDRLYADALNAHVAVARGDTLAALRRFEKLHADFPGRQLMWQPALTLAPTRLLQAEVLLAQGSYGAADSIAAKLDEVPILALLPALPSVLSLRARIAQQAGMPERARGFRERLARLESPGR